MSLRTKMYVLGLAGRGLGLVYLALALFSARPRPK